MPTFVIMPRENSECEFVPFQLGHLTAAGGAFEEGWGGDSRRFFSAFRDRSMWGQFLADGLPG